MFKFRLAILGATAALALGTASVLAMSESIGAGDSDSHGDAVASAARNCPHGASGVHGACVSAVAHENNGQSHRDGQQSARVQACRAAMTGTDRAAHIAFAECVSGHAKNGKSPKSPDATDMADTAETGS
jgi:hypothetical protein